MQNSKSQLQKGDKLVLETKELVSCLLNILKLLHSIRSFETCRSFDILCSFQNSTDTSGKNQYVWWKRLPLILRTYCRMRPYKTTKLLGISLQMFEPVPAESKGKRFMIELKYFQLCIY